MTPPASACKPATGPLDRESRLQKLQKAKEKFAVRQTTQELGRLAEPQQPKQEPSPRGRGNSAARHYEAKGPEEPEPAAGIYAPLRS